LQVKRLRVNRIKNPLGFEFADGGIRLSFIAEGTKAKKMVAARIEVSTDETFRALVYDSGKDESIDSLAFLLPLETLPRTRYYWRASVWADNGDFAVSEAAWFETAKQNEPWLAKWITPDMDQKIQPVLLKSFASTGKIAGARAYVCGIGLYELYINGKKAGDEYLTPNYNNYEAWVQYQTYDVTDMLAECNELEIMLGLGWYRGRFGFFEDGECINMFGDHFALLFELHITYADGSTAVIGSDTSWLAKKSKVQASSIYDGESCDAMLDDSERFSVAPFNFDASLLKARLSLPVKVMKRIKPIAVLTTPKNEIVIDMGQNMVGWLEMKINAPMGTKIFLQHGEILQEDCFFNLNLRSAKAEYTYISGGGPAAVRPFFTFFGFRYVKVEGWPGVPSVDDFEGCVVYSALERTGHIETSDPLINKLYENAYWGQIGNFLDVPTDCPQRDERMGWTGDAQVFCGTASFNTDTYAFFNKYLFDLHTEQKRENGRVPFTIPDMIRRPGEYGSGSCAWGDAATIMPWNTYLFYGDKAILAQQFQSMKSWVDYIRRVDAENGKHNLWLTGFHFGDWLALDSPEPGSCEGGTDKYFIASAYYAYSTELVVKAARVLGKTEEEAEYSRLLADIKQAIHDEFYTKTGRLAVPTQTGMVLSLFMNLVPEEHRQRMVETLRTKLEQDKLHLKTGFVGTAYLTRTLSDNGLNDIAYTLLLNQDYPSWLYEVVMGATTVWERWNSLLPDGTISDLTMNSFNHYAYGAVIEWVYRNVSGLRPQEKAPGFKRVTLAPQPDARLSWVNTSYDSAAGRYESRWSHGDDGKLTLSFTIPFNTEADLILPNASDWNEIAVNGKTFAESGLAGTIEGATARALLTSGEWSFSYRLQAEQK